MVKTNRGTDSHEDCKFNRLSVLQSFFPPHVYRVTRQAVGKSRDSGFSCSQKCVFMRISLKMSVATTVIA